MLGLGRNEERGLWHGKRQFTEPSSATLPDQSLATFPLDLWEAHLGQCFPLLRLRPLVAVLAERREQLLWGPVRTQEKPCLTHQDS